MRRDACVKKLYWLSDTEWARIEPLLPRGRRSRHHIANVAIMRRPGSGVSASERALSDKGYLFIVSRSQSAYAGVPPVRIGPSYPNSIMWTVT